MTSSDKLFELVNSESLNELTELFHQDPSVSEVINSTNTKKETPLHTASGKLHPDLILLLLECGADPNAQDLEGRTPVLTLLLKLRECFCESCQRKAVRCINILGEFRADMNIEDRQGEFPLHFAAEAQWPECASALLDNKATVGMYGHKPMLTILLERIPSVISSVFDRSIDVGSNKFHDADFEVSFDLRVLLPVGTMMSCSHPKKESTVLNSSEKVHPDDSYTPRREMGFLHDLVNSAQGAAPSMYTTILYHPLVHVFTDIKWKRLQLFYCFHLSVQAVFLVAYTAYLFLLTYYDCPYTYKGDPSQIQMPNGTVIKGDVNISNQNEALRGTGNIYHRVGEVILGSDYWGADREVCRLSLITTAVAGFVLLCTMYLMAVEMKQALLDFKSYIRDMLNYCQLLCIAAVLLTILVALDSKSRLDFWVYPVAGFGMMMSWLQLFFLVGRLPLLSIYVDMFVKVTIRFIWSLLIYSSIVVAFAMSYCILFPLEPRITDIPLALIKMLTMLVGELDYAGLFSGPNKSPITSHLWYAAFVVLVTLILMNLLVGLAVSDIQVSSNGSKIPLAVRCRKHAEILVIKRRIRYLWYVEKSFFLGTLFMPRRLRDFMRKCVSVLVPKEELPKQKFSAFINGCYRVRPNDSSDSTLTRETRYCIKQWLEHRVFAQMKENCKRRTVGIWKAKTRKRLTPEPANLEFEGANVQTTRLHSTPPRLSWSAKEDDQEVKSFNKVQFNVSRMERKLEELDMKIDSFIKRFDSLRHGEDLK